MSDYRWPLMANAIGEIEKTALIEFIKESNRFTNGPQVKEFEDAWAEWLGVKHSVFVNSGSSANTLLLWAIKKLRFQDPYEKMVVLTPACTWATNIATMQQFQIDFVIGDNDLFDFGFSEESLEKLQHEHPEINVVWATHLMGSPSNMELISRYFPDAIIIEDCCESHGAVFDSEKVGTLGVGSTFSFYFGHHMTTIEGGMISTDDDDLYYTLKMLRSHGMSRELPAHIREKYETNSPSIDPRFLFPLGGFNFRNTEINAVLGKQQLAQLDQFIAVRKANLIRFDELLACYPELFERFNTEGNSSMVLPFLCKTPEIRERTMETLERHGIETRPFLVGNILEQPFVETSDAQLPTPNADYLHENAFYIGNNQFIGAEEFVVLEGALAEVLYHEVLNRGE